ncbi:60S ribosomal protein L34 [Tanacetum coccineum]
MRLTVNFHHDGNFVPSPLMYQEGDESIIHDIEFEGMTVARLSKMLQGTCMFPVKGIFFLVPGKELSNGLIHITNDLDLANCIAIGYKNGKVIDVFLEHHGYDLSHWIQTDINNNDDEIFDVELEDITGYAASDFVGEDDVVIPNRSINDPFLNKLCNGSYINDFSDKPDVGESSQPCGKELGIDSDDEDVDKQFKLVDGGCRKVIGLDGCFLKGTCRGKLLTAMGRDGNNQMFPIAWVVVNVENTNNWEWFLACLCEDLRLNCGAYMTIILDGHKGLMEAVKNLLPYAENRQSSTVQHNFYTKLNLIGNINPEAKQWLVDRNPNNGCRAFFKIDRGCAAYENGISESYHNFIRIARGKPLITMLEEIRVYLMQRLYSMHNLATNLVDSITPSIRKEIERLKHSQRYWTVYPSGNNVFEVRKGDDSYGVNIENRTCTCKCWDLSGVPCVHSVAAFSFLKNDPILGVSDWYSKKMWQNAYSYFIKPVGGSSMWPQTPKEPPLPPVLRKIPGRPRKLRIKHVTERVNVITRSGRMMTCQNCWEKDHNKKTYKKKKQPKPTIEKRAPRRKKVGSNFVFQAGPSVADPFSAGPSVADPSSTGPSVADSTGSGTRAETVTEDPIVADPTDDIPTQQSKTSDTAKIIEDAIATRRLKIIGLKRRCKSERIAKRAKAFQFGKDGAGSCSEKAWDVDDVLAEK